MTKFDFNKLDGFKSRRWRPGVDYLVNVVLSELISLCGKTRDF